MGTGRWLATHRKTVVAVWVIVLLALSITSRLVDSQFRSNFAVPGSESNDALQLLEETFPELANASVTVVYSTDEGSLEDGDNRQLIDETVTNLENVPDVASVSSPTAFPQRFLDVSSNREIAYSTVFYTESLNNVSPDAFDELVDAITPAREAGLAVDLDGQLVDQQNLPRGGLSDYADLISVIIAVLIITIAFGAPIVALMPIAVALAALATGLSVLSFVEIWVDIASVNEVLGSMLALGVGIDYSLLIVNRHRQLRADGRAVPDAIDEAWRTAGTSVMLAGATVCVATCALAIVGVPMITKLGLTSAMFVAFTVVAALTLLPALLGFAGENLDRWALPWAGTRSRFWPWWADTNARFRWPLAIVPLAILAMAIVPVPKADLGIIDDGSMPESLTQRQAYDTIADGFGVGANGPLIVVAELPTDGDREAVASALVSLNRAIRQTEGVASASPPRISGTDFSIDDLIGDLGPTVDSDSGDGTAPSTTSPPTTAAPATTVAGSSDDPQVRAMVMRVIPETSPDDPATTDLVNTLRDDVVPQAVEGTVLEVDTTYVGGQTAVNIDFTERIQDRLVLFIAVVLGIAFLLLMAAFRSLVIPVKAAVMALVSFFVAYGVTVAVFQWGWLRSAIGLDMTVPVETFFPLMLFAILFGLSMDYEVFLVSRIHEEHERGEDANRAVTIGLATTGKIILTAGLIMTSVFLAFSTNPSPVVKQLAFGMAVAVAVDAIIIRLVVVPGLLHLFGRATWWFPRWLDRILPKVRIG